MLDFPETSEAVILVKAAPNIGAKHGETVCCAGVTRHGEWVRLYPVTFRSLNPDQQFRRWDIVRCKWRKPTNEDPRLESRRIDHQSIEIIGQLKDKDREKFLASLEVGSLKSVASQGKSLALLRPKNPQFYYEKKTADDIAEEQQKYDGFWSQFDLFNAKPDHPLEPCPYKFKYRYETDDGKFDGTCQDWETHATFFRWSRSKGEAYALTEMQRIFGEEYPEKGMVFAMGTHSRWPTWLINGIIRLDEIKQGFLDL